LTGRRLISITAANVEAGGNARGRNRSDHDDNSGDDDILRRSVRNEKSHSAVSANRASREQHCAASTSARDVRWPAKSSLRERERERESKGKRSESLVS